MKKTLITLLTLMVISSNSQVVPNKDWIKTYSQRGSITNGPTAIDANNNVFLTGYTGSYPATNILTQKRDSLGNLIFTTAYNNGGYDQGNAIKIDGNNVYVAGVSYASTTNNDGIILKYSGTGTLLWQYRYDKANNLDEAVDIKTDVNGNVYALIKSKNSSGDYDMITLKLDPNGNYQWAHTKDVSGLDDFPTGLVIIGNYVYIAGTTTDANNGTDIILYQLDTNSGTPGWSAIINGTANGNDRANGISISGADVIICGEVLNTTLDGCLARFNANSGMPVYQKNYDYNNSTNRATALVRDSTGNIATVNIVLDGGIYKYHTVLYDSTGTQLWVNIENTGLSTLSVDPRIACDTIASHFYVCGEKMKTSKDMFVYQITPGGNTNWRETIDGQNSDVDAATGLAVNGVGVVYLCGLSKNSSANYDYTTVKINQTPVYFPPDIVTNEKPMASHLYYENKGQVVYMNNGAIANDILFSTMEYYYPVTYVATNKIYYKLYKQDNNPNGNDTMQRIDITMLGANPLAEAYPFQPNHGTVSYMMQGLPDAVTGVQGYERYFIPNIYPGIDMHYFSNENGIKLYYVLKPMADVSNIQWEIAGANSTGIVNNKLEIQGFDKKITYGQPKAYTVNNFGQAVALTSTGTANWVNNGSYGISLPAYNSAWPLIVELDYGNSVAPTSSSNDNIALCTYYGGGLDDGFTDIDVDKTTGDYVVLGATRGSQVGTQFPILPGTTVSATSNTNSPSTYITLVLFDKDGVRKAANTYGGGITATISAIKAILQGRHITIIGNTGFGTSGLLPTYTSLGPLTAGCYSTNPYGYGYVLQFEYVPVSSTAANINKITWNGRLNGYASDIDKTPDGKFIYISSVTDIVPTDTYPVTGSYNKSTITNGGNPNGSSNYQVSKFDSLGIRKWSSLLPVLNSNPTYTAHNLFDNTANLLSEDAKVKCRIACDNYGFYLAGESDDVIASFTTSIYGAPCSPPYGFKDAVFARFNKKDGLVYTGYFGGGSGDEAFNDIAIVNPNEIVVTGYGTSNWAYATNLFKPNSGGYLDTNMANVNVGPNVPNGALAKMYVAKFDSTGNMKWGTYWGNNTGGECIGWGVTADYTGKIFVAGKDKGSFVFPQTNPSGLYSQTSINQSESYMVCFDGGNNAVWNTRFGGIANEIGLDLEYNAVNDVLIKTGITNSNNTNTTSPFPNFPSTNPNAWYQSSLSNNHDGYIVHFKTNTITGINEFLLDKKRTEAFALFPNPAQNQFALAFKNELKGKVKIEVFDQMGSLLASEERNEVLANNVLNISSKGLTNGMYIVKVSNNVYTYSQKLIISK